jgi:hypothetical protein
MLSTAAVAVLSGMAMADTTIDSSKTDPYTTGALASSSYTGTANAGSVTITSAGSIAVAKTQPALTVNTSSWVLVKGAISNKDNDNASAILVDMSTNPVLSGASFQNSAGTTITGTGIYLDSSATVSVSGSNAGKVGIFFDSASCTSSASCTYKGGFATSTGSALTVSGDKGTAFQLGSSANSYAILKGDVTLNGTISSTAATTTNTATSNVGFLSYGTIDGNLILNSGSTVAAYGHGAIGMSIQGLGITKALTIGGTITSSILSSNNYNYNQTVNTTTNAEAGSALQIGASVQQGIEILGPTTYGASAATGTISTSGTSPAVYISPSLNLTVGSPTSNLTIGVYTADTANPGFSFYNRGSIAASYTNYNKTTTAMAIAASSSALPTTLTGGLYNSGSMTASSVTSGTSGSSSSVVATGLSIGNYVVLGAGLGKNAGSGTTSPGNQAALVIDGLGSASGGGSITASVSGTRGGIAEAIVISSYATVPSLINSGTISAQATTTDATLAGGLTSSNPVAAVAILDASGTLTSIVNSGTISAQAGYVTSSGATSVSVLDNDKQVAVAIQLGGSASSASAAGTTIKNYSTAARAATIVGDINYGTGVNQILDLIGNGPTLYSTVTGNVTFGMIPAGSTSGDKLHIGNYAVLSGIVTTQETVKGAGVQVDVDTHGTLNLLNTTTALNATQVTVNTGGTLNLGVSRSLTTSGVVAAQSVKFANDATLGVTYQSYVPQATKQFVLMTADSGQLAISQTVINTFNTALNSTGSSIKPYLLKTATMCSTQLDASCRPSSLASTQDALVINVVTKSAAELGLNAASVAAMPITTANGKATTLFEQANLALGIDDALGSAFMNGITDAKQAAKAYNNMAPNITGGTRAIALSITDSATGPVAARQRALRMYDKTEGDMTIWGQEFVQMIKDPGTGAIDANTGFKTSPGFKDHGFGFSLGIDSGSPKYGWYGGALTFYAGDVNELSRDAHVNEQWYLLSLYSSWRGKGLFIDTKLDAGYGNIDGKRTMLLSIPNYAGTAVSYYGRQANNKHAGALVSGSVVTGVSYAYGAATLMPQINIDGMLMREEGYTETNPGTTTTGDGFDLKVQQAYAKSLRAFVGFNARYDLELWDFFLQPEGRIGYRYDLLNDPAKIKAAFAYSNVTTNAISAGDTFTLTGPEPSQGSFVLGGSLAATTDSWTLGLNFDFVKGSNGAFQQVGTLHLLGRI